jgi:uncharacterized membrane protein YoaK (UPF0700 family)
LYRLFPPLRGTIAGIVDEIGYLSLGLFTTPVARNLVVIATFVMRGCPPNMALILAVPGFMIPVAAVWFIAKAHDRRGPSLIGPPPVVHFLLLASDFQRHLYTGHFAVPSGRARRVSDGRDDASHA